jgi:hypothetical protein
MGHSVGDGLIVAALAAAIAIGVPMARAAMRGGS